MKIILSIGVALFLGGICEIYRYLTRPKITVILTSKEPIQQPVEESIYFTIIDNLFAMTMLFCGALLTLIALKKLMANQNQNQQ